MANDQDDNTMIDPLQVPDLPPLEALAHIPIAPDLTLPAALAAYHQASLDMISREGPMREMEFNNRLQAFLDLHTKGGIVDLLPATIATKREQITRELDEEFRDATSRFQLGRLVAGVLLQRELDRVQLPTWRGRLSPTAAPLEQMAARSLDLAEAREAREWLRGATLDEAVRRYEATPDDETPGFVNEMETDRLPAARPGHDADVLAIMKFQTLKRQRKAARIPTGVREALHGYTETLHSKATRTEVLARLRRVI